MSLDAKQAMQQRAHALLSPSASSRWLACPPSARLEDQLPDSSSEYAEEGTTAHALAALKLEKAFTQMPPSRYKTEIAKIRKDPLYQKEMETCTDGYLDYIKQLAINCPTKPVIAIESTVDLAAYVPESFGSADCILISGTNLWVVDYKHGKGVPVSAYDNPQCKLYALGAMLKYRMFYQIETVHMTIYQPRLENISEWQMSATDLIAWAEAIKPIAEQAFMGLGEYNPSPETCKFCRAAGTCKARADYNLMQLEGAVAAIEETQPKINATVKIPDTKTSLLSLEDMGYILDIVQDVTAWIRKLEIAAQGKILDGQEVPGWKVVEGRSNRVITDYDEAAAKLKAEGYKPAALYEKKPLTLTALESLVGRAELAQTLGDLIQKPPGKPTLAPASDKREPFKKLSAEDEFKQFEKENTNNG